MAARILELRNALAVVIRARITGADRTQVVTKFWADKELTLINSRQVHIFTDGWGNPDAADRGADWIDYRFRIVTWSRHTGELRDRDNWAECELGWVDSKIWPVTNARESLLSGTAFCNQADVLTDYDPDLLVEKALFFNEILTVWREPRTY